MRRLLSVMIVTLLVTGLVAACGGGDETATRAPDAAPQQATPSVDNQGTTDEDGQAMTDEGGQGMTDEDGQAMTDEGGQGMTDEDGQGMTDEDGQGMTDEGDQAMADEGDQSMADEGDQSMADEGHALSPECVPGGALDNAEAISDCSAEAVQGIESFAFDAEFDLAAVFPFDLAMDDGTDGGAMEDPFGQSAMTYSGAVILPDRVMYSISLGLGDETLEINGIAVGTDNYVQDPESGVWLHGDVPLGELASVTSQPGLMLHPQEEGAMLTEVAALDGTQVYVLVSEPAAADDPLMPGQAVTRFVGVDDFLPREVRIKVLGLGDTDRDIVTIRYHSYNQVDEIEPPANAISMPAMPEDSMASSSGGSPTVIGISSNASGDIAVVFSEPVYVEGTVGLYVLDLETGGWELPLLGGSGTDTLTFAANVKDSPPLVAGEHQIGGITFPEPESEIADADGNWPILDFEPWTYE